ncbi:MAG: ATP-binding protein [Desulfobacterales bacterium]
MPEVECGRAAAAGANERLLEELPILLIGLAEDLRVTLWNRLAEELLGMPAERVIGRPFPGLPPGNDGCRLRCGLEECRRRGGCLRLEEIPCRRPDGKEGLLGLTVHRLAGRREAETAFLVVGADVTERRRLERELTQALKLRSLGQLAAGIAHEINTPTQFVGDNARFLQSAFDDLLGLLRVQEEVIAELRAATGGEAHPRLAAARARADLDYLRREVPAAVRQTLEGVERIARIVRAMKDFAHPGRREKEACDLNRIIDTTITVARNEWKYVAEVETDLDPALPPVVCDAAEIGQVVLNLLINAAHAIEDRLRREPAAGKGRIRIETRAAVDRAQIRIADDGCGIPPEVRPRIFEPFFTTKEVGRGTGQGLALCHAAIVERHGGRISFDTAVGRGTTFTIEIPVGGPGEDP